MKTFHKLLALATIALGITACQQENTPSVQGDADAVKITASIGALQTRVSYDNNGGTSFGLDDQIKVENKLRTSKNVATYTLTTEGWNTADAFVWNGASKNEFEAWYPLTASYTTFTIPADQSSEQLLGAADWMTASSGEIDKPENHTLDLSFQHRLAMVTVNITKWGNDFEGTEQISSPKIYTKGTALTATYDDSGVTITTTGDDIAINPLESGTSYTAIVAPAKYATDDKFMTFLVNGQEMTVLGNSTLTNEGLQAGVHYIFNLKVGKDAVTISSVSVTDWGNGGTIDGGVAKEKECEHETTIIHGTCVECGKLVYVDLGLSVNWATVNIGATKPEEVGDFFAWGETSPKTTYTWNTYVWGTENNLTKYNSTDSKTTLEAGDDAAVQNWGDGWMMPTLEQMEELLDEENCTRFWTTVSGVNGYQITSKVPGYEGNSIFLPFVLYKDDGGTSIANRAVYWTRTLSNIQTTTGSVFTFNSINYVFNGYHRYRGCLIRPVREK